MKKRKGIRSIKAQMLIATSLIAILLTIGILSSVSMILSSEYDKEIKERNETLTQLISGSLENFLNTAYSVTEELADNSDLLSLDPARIEPVLIKCGERNSYIELLFVQEKGGMQIARSSGECGDRSQRWWFKDVHENGRSFISKSYLSASSDGAVTTVFRPLLKDGQIVGSIGMDIKLNYLQELILENQDDANGRYSFIIDGEGVIIAHPDTSYITEMYNYKTLSKQVPETDGSGKAILNEDGSKKLKEESIDLSEGYKTIIADVMAGGSGSTYFDDNGEGYYGAYSPIALNGESDNWSVITIQKESSAKAIIQTIIKISISAGIGLILAAFVFIFLFARSIANPIVKISGLLSKTAAGDFTVSFHTRSKSEIGLLADNFNEMVHKVSGLLASTKDITENINGSIIILSDKAGEAANAADSIGNSVKEILAGSMEQANDAAQSAALSNRLEQQFANLSSKTGLMMENARNAAAITSDAAQKVDELKNKNQLGSEMIEKTASAIDKLNEESKRIGSILNTLDDISSQTNLLSLNASIEAARAGEHGKSFAVVAEEIQKLSAASSDSTKNIEGIITEIQSEIQASVNMMDSVKHVSREQQDAFEDVKKVFSMISDTTKSITGFISEIDNFVEQMQESNSQIVSSITNISAISQETAACTESVNLAIAEQNKGIAHIASQAEELKEKSIILEGEIDKFAVTTEEKQA